jgi:hypothetical protein
VRADHRASPYGRPYSCRESCVGMVLPRAA